MGSPDGIGTMSDAASRQLGIAAALMSVLIAGVAASSLWRASSEGPLPKLPRAPSLRYSSPVFAPRAEAAGALPVPATFGQGWRIINQYSAHRVLLVEVETQRIDHAVAIAEEAIGGVKESYSEVLVYFHRPKRSRVLASARVQWTPRHGYRLIDYEALDGES